MSTFEDVNGSAGQGHLSSQRPLRSTKSVGSAAFLQTSNSPPVQHEGESIYATASNVRSLNRTRSAPSERQDEIKFSSPPTMQSETFLLRPSLSDDIPLENMMKKSSNLETIEVKRILLNNGYNATPLEQSNALPIAFEPMATPDLIGEEMNEGDFNTSPAGRARSKTSSKPSTSRGQSPSRKVPATPDTSIRQSFSHGDLSILQNQAMGGSRYNGQYHTAMPNIAAKRSASRPRGSLHIRTSLTAPDLPPKQSPPSFLNLEDSPKFEYRTPLETSKSEGFRSARNAEFFDSAPPDAATLTFDELVSHLLVPPPSKINRRFLSTFLAFYRMFAAPLQLLGAITSHFNALESFIAMAAMPQSTLERDLTIIEQWISSYPGDFAKFVTRQKLRMYLAKVTAKTESGISTQKLTFDERYAGVDTASVNMRIAATAEQIRLALDSVNEDDDTEWACSDSGLYKRSRSKTFLSTSSLDSEDDQKFFGGGDSMKRSATNTDLDERIIFGGHSTLTLNAIGRSRLEQELTNPLTVPINVAYTAARQADRLSPDPRKMFCKDTWRRFITTSDDAVARELTRIDWIMFLSIRSRDLIRHVTIPADERGKFPALQNVNRMIGHFNHLANWVANVVLFRDKPKHRAQALEKFMRISRKLRELNNYNALGAVVAGIHNTAVHRLKATRDLVNPDVAMDFLKVEILMATAKGHSAYRLAWENTSTHRIPYLPLHRRDLVVATGAGKTFVEKPAELSSQEKLLEFENLSRTTTQKSEISEMRDDDTSYNSQASKTVSSLSTALPTQSITKIQFPQQSQSPLHSQQQQINPLSPSSISTTATSNDRNETRRINWPKFAIMGDILSSFQAAQAKPYVGFAANEEVRTFLLDYIIVEDEDELYQRSTSLEPPAFAGAGSGSGGVGGVLDVRIKKKITDRLGRVYPGNAFS